MRKLRFFFLLSILVLCEFIRRVAGVQTHMPEYFAVFWVKRNDFIFVQPYLQATFDFTKLCFNLSEWNLCKARVNLCKESMRI